MRQQSSQTIRRAKRRALTVELLEDRRVFSLTGLVPSLPGLLSQPVSLSAVSPVTPVTNVLTDTTAVATPPLSSLPVVALEAEVRLDSGAGGLRVELEVTTPVLDVVVASDLGVNLPVNAGADVSLHTSLGGDKGLVTAGATVGAGVKIDLSPETGLPPIGIGTGTGVQLGVGGDKSIVPIDATVGSTTKIDVGGSAGSILPPVSVSTGTDTQVSVGGDKSTLPVDVTATITTTTAGGSTEITSPVTVTVGATVTDDKGSGNTSNQQQAGHDGDTHGGGVPGDIRTGGQTSSGGPNGPAGAFNNNSGGPLAKVMADAPGGGAASPAAAGGPSVDAFFRQLSLDGGGNAGLLANAADALAVEQLAIVAPAGVGGAQDEDQDGPELQGAHSSGLSADLATLAPGDSQVFRAVGEQLSALLAGTGTAPWLLALLAVAATACEITRRQLRHSRPRLSLVEAAALTGFSGLGTLWPLE